MNGLHPKAPWNIHFSSAIKFSGIIVLRLAISSGMKMPKMWIPAWFVAAKNPSLLCRIRSSFWAVKGSELSQQPWATIVVPFHLLGCSVFKKIEKLPDLPFQLKWTRSAMMSPRFYDFGRWLEKLGLHSGVVSFWLVTGLSTDFVLIASCNLVLNCTASKSVTLYSVYYSVLSPQFAVGVALLGVLLSA